MVGRGCARGSQRCCAAAVLQALQTAASPQPAQAGRAAGEAPGSARSSAARAHLLRQQAAVTEDNVVHHQHGGVLGQLARHGAAGRVKSQPCPRLVVPVGRLGVAQAVRHRRLPEGTRGDIPAAQAGGTGRRGVRGARERTSAHGARFYHHSACALPRFIHPLQSQASRQPSRAPT